MLVIGYLLSLSGVGGGWREAGYRLIIEKEGESE